MATNNSGTTVYVHTDEGTKIIAPGEDFPSGVDIDKSLTGDAADGEEEVVAGPSQRLGPDERTPYEGPTSAWRDVKVPQIRAALDAGGVEYTDEARKDDLVALASSAGVTPEQAKTYPA